MGLWWIRPSANTNGVVNLSGSCIRSLLVEGSGFDYTVDNLIITPAVGSDSDEDGLIDSCDNSTRDTSTTIQPNVPTVQTAQTSKDAQWFRLDVTVPGSIISATMSSEADYDLFLFAPRIDQEYGQLRDIGRLVDIAQLTCQ